MAQWITVQVSQENQVVWDYDGKKHATQVKLTHAVEVWLETLIGYRTFLLVSEDNCPLKSIWVISENWHSLGLRKPTRIYFSNLKHATMFRHTWAPEDLICLPKQNANF